MLLDGKKRREKQQGGMKRLVDELGAFGFLKLTYFWSPGTSIFAGQPGSRRGVAGWLPRQTTIAAEETVQHDL